MDNEELNIEAAKLVAAVNDGKHDFSELSDMLWNVLMLYQGTVFHTVQGLDFKYTIKGYELFVDRKDKSITKSTVDKSFAKALELGGIVTGPKKLGTFGASYLYPVFIAIGIIK